MPVSTATTRSWPSACLPPVLMGSMFISRTSAAIVQIEVGTEQNRFHWHVSSKPGAQGEFPMTLRVLIPLPVGTLALEEEAYRRALE